VVQVEVQPSAVLELTWIVEKLHWHQEPEWLRQDEAATLRAQLEAMWPNEDLECAPAEMSILAERVGALLTDEADSFLGGLERAARLDGVGLELRSETPAVREATIARLERLRREPGLARNYAALLGSVWDLVRQDWEDVGREAVHRTCTEWSHRLRQGGRIWDLLPSKHIAHKPAMEALLTQRPRVVLTPLHFSARGGFVIDMTTFVHVGGPANLAGVEELRRRESEEIAARMKVLADGTRVALLRELAAEPASVMDLARRFELAQPTVSNHVRLMRDAGLLESRKEGPKVVYRVPREQLERLLDDTRHLLLEH
jgi:ArsR family transcriptional regulator